MIMILEDLGLGFPTIFELKPITTIFPCTYFRYFELD
jgi:hypothetical protein